MTTKAKIAERRMLKRALFMLVVLAYLLIITMLQSCTKGDYRPDHDQVFCKQCYSIRQYWSDTTASKFEVRPTDTAVNRRLCEQTLINFQKADTSKWVTYCNNPNGEIIYWIHYINQTK